MFDTQLDKARQWFDARDLREKILLSVLTWALIYACFSIFLYLPVDKRVQDLGGKIKKHNEEIANWKTQLKFLEDIKTTPIYKEWVTHNKSYESLRKAYKNILGKPIDEQWREITNTVLQNHPNIVIDEINNTKESLFQSSNINKSMGEIYQQQMHLSIFGNFADIVNYLEILENGLPNIYWNSLNYTVTEYPLAKADLEFAVLYEKVRNK